MKPLFRNIAVITLLSIVMVGCGDDDEQECPPCNDPTNVDCPNYDPCLGEKPVSATFKIYDDIFSGGPNSDLWYEDSVLYRGRVKFEAVEDSAIYKWNLGQETIEGTEYQEGIRTLVDLNPGTYTAALRVQKAPDIACFPNDVGVDSTYRTFQVVGVCDLMIMNKFKGVFASAPQDSVIIELFPWKFLPGNQDWILACEDISGIGYINFSGDNDTIRDGSLVSVGLLNRYFYRPRNVGDPFLPKGYLEVFPDGSCKAEYDTYGVPKVFNGKIFQP